MNALQVQLLQKQLRQEKRIDRQPSKEALSRLPRGHSVLGTVLTEDMGGTPTEAILACFSDNHGIRVAHFRLDNGEYLDDYIL